MTTIGHDDVANFRQKCRWLLAGAAAGLTVDLSLYPLDTIKTRMQSKAGFRTSGGFRQIYRGVPAVALGSAPGSALFFLSYSSSRHFLHQQFANHTASSSIDAISATFGEVVACVARVPTEIVKQRAQTRPNSSLLQIVREIHGARGIGGIWGFYKGYKSTVCREIPFSLIEFPLWEWLKRRWEVRTGQKCSPLESAACGSLAGLVAAAMTTPLDVLKTRTMLDRSTGKGRPSLLQLGLEIARKEGPLRLYSGVVPRSLWMCLGGFIFFFSYELSLRAAHYIIV